jgi:hypothetical protein
MKKTNTTPSQQLSDDHATLDHRYGKIGISAVAAAVKYQSAAKNPVYAPAEADARDWDSEAA